MNRPPVDAERPRLTDPVCGAELPEIPPAFVRHDGADRHFCSEKCLRVFLDEPDRFAA